MTHLPFQSTLDSFAPWNTIRGLMHHFWSTWAASPFAFCVTASLAWFLFYVGYTSLRTISRRHRSPFNDLPGPKPNFWLWDHAFDILREPLGHCIVPWINERPYPSGLMHFFGLYGSEYLVPTSPETLTECLSTNAQAFQKPSAFRNYTERFFGHGLVTQEGGEHKFFRKTYLQAFNQNAVNMVTPLLLGKSRQVLRGIDEQCSIEDKNHAGLDCAPGEADVQSTIIHVTQLSCMVFLDVAGLLSMGVDLATLDGKNLDIVHALETILLSTPQKRLGFIIHNLFPRWITRFYRPGLEKKMEHAREVMASFVRRTIREKKLQGRSPSPLGDYHTKLLETSDVHEAEVIPQILTILTAGYESAGTTLAWTIYCLATHPDTQTSLRKELHEHLINDSEESNRDSQYDDLPLLNAIVMESARLYPTFPFIARKTIQATTLGGRHVPGGVYIGISPVGINYARHLWGADAEFFRPGRWIDGSDPACIKQNPLGGAPASICMMSFGYGARSCVGRAWSVALIKRQVAVLVQRFRLECVDGEERPSPEGLFAMGPPSDLKVRCTRISSSSSSSS